MRREKKKGRKNGWERRDRKMERRSKKRVENKSEMSEGR